MATAARSPPAAGRGRLRPAEPRPLPGEGWQGWGCGVEGERDGERDPLRPPLKAFVAWEGAQPTERWLKFTQPDILPLLKRITLLITCFVIVFLCHEACSKACLFRYRFLLLRLSQPIRTLLQQAWHAAPVPSCREHDSGRC